MCYLCDFLFLVMKGASKFRSSSEMTGFPDFDNSSGVYRCLTEGNMAMEYLPFVLLYQGTREVWNDKLSHTSVAHPNN